MDLTSLLTVAQNIATAINNAAQAYLNVQGTQTLADIDAATLVKIGPGRVATVSVIDAGSAVGAVYDASVSTATTGQVFVIPMTVGVHVVNMPVLSGIVVAPGTGQTVAVSYSAVT